MIHAINKHGRESWFSDKVWEKMPKHKNGWIEFGTTMGEVLIPQQIIEFQQSKKEAVTVEEKSEPKVHTKTPPAKRNTKKTVKR